MTWWPVMAASWSWRGAMFGVVALAIPVATLFVVVRVEDRVREHCATLYARARTAADSAAVDREPVPGNSRNPLAQNCGALRQHGGLPRLPAGD